MEKSSDLGFISISKADVRGTGTSLSHGMLVWDYKHWGNHSRKIPFHFSALPWGAEEFLCPQYRSDTQSSHCQLSLKYNLFYKHNSQSSSWWWNSKKPSKNGSTVTNIEGPVSRRLLLGWPLGYNPAGSDGFLNMSRKVLPRQIFQPPQKFLYIINYSLLGKYLLYQASSNPAIEKGGAKSPSLLFWFSSLWARMENALVFWRSSHFWAMQEVQGTVQLWVHLLWLSASHVMRNKFPQAELFIKPHMLTDWSVF